MQPRCIEANNYAWGQMCRYIETLVKSEQHQQGQAYTSS